MSIQVILKTVYGNETIYPVCEKAHAFARLAGQKTLTMREVNIIKGLGYEVQVVQPGKVVL